ncbi:MAG: AbrB family transcriptional regulator [Rhodospirillaceae bacterium]|nr:AbrB family transcriptional regulator [Rhodospirillaceae bacterium]
MSAEPAQTGAAPPPPSTRARIANAFLTLALGAGGGWIANRLGLPLAWMIGAMIATTIGSMSGLKLYVHRWVRGPNVAVLGVMLGSSFAPGVLARIGDWLATIAGLVAYLSLATGLLYVYFRRFGRFDPVTAFFAASPGGLNEMVIVGRELGGDDRIIALVHGARILMVVMVIPFGFVLFEHYSQASRPPPGGALLDLPWREALILAACALSGATLARWIGMPAAFVTGPMFLSAAVHLLGWSEARPPAVLVQMAQIVLGSGVGARFAGVSPITILRVLGLSVGSTVVMVALTLGFAVVLHSATDTSIQAVILAYSPGGLAEMSLVALALAIDSAFVATHHVVRIVMIVVVAPTLFRWLRRRR